MIDKGTLQKYDQHIFKKLWVKYQGHILKATVSQNDIRMHSQESDPMGNSLQKHEFVSRARSLVFSYVRSETKGSRFNFGCYLCTEVSSLH